MFWIAYGTAKYHSSFRLKKWIRPRKTGLHILAMFARNFFSRERYIIPSYAYKGKEILFGGTEILQKNLEKVALAREKFPNLCDKTKLPTQYITKCRKGQNYGGQKDGHQSSYWLSLIFCYLKQSRISPNVFGAAHTGSGWGLLRLYYEVKHRRWSCYEPSIESNRAGVFDLTDGSERAIAHSMGNLSRCRNMYQM